MRFSMRIIKVSSFILFAALFMTAFMPQLSAKRHSSFSFNLNLTPTPHYVEYNYVAPQPVYTQPVYTVVQPYAPVYQHHTYYQPVVRRKMAVRRPYVKKVYVQPQYSYWGFF
jgi:hypothetical protein